MMQIHLRLLYKNIKPYKNRKDTVTNFNLRIPLDQEHITSMLTKPPELTRALT